METRADLRHGEDRRPTRTRLIATLAVVAVLLVAALGAKVFLGGGDGGAGDDGRPIDRATSCADYLRAPTRDRADAVRVIGAQVGATGADTASARPNVDYTCQQLPEAPVGDVIARQNY